MDKPELHDLFKNICDIPQSEKLIVDQPIMTDYDLLSFFRNYQQKELDIEEIHHLINNFTLNEKIRYPEEEIKITFL
jgi:hypothetical protein